MYCMKNTLKLNKEFRRLYARGKSCATGSVIVYAMKKRYGENRIGITVGKTVGNAVKRNRAKRLIRESYSQTAERILPGYDFVFVARARTPGLKCSAVQRDMEYALRKLGLLQRK